MLGLHYKFLWLVAVLECSAGKRLWYLLCVKSHYLQTGMFWAMLFKLLTQVGHIVVYHCAVTVC